MRVLVTGGTGFIGSHVVAALLEAGLDARLLVRDPAKIARVLEPHGRDASEVGHVHGDMTDLGAVRASVAGCDAVVHAAAVVSMQRADGPAMIAANQAGARNVLVEALGAGLDPVVHVSSIAAVAPAPGGPRRATDPIAAPLSAYSQSKGDAERVARGLQRDGAPVTIVYPGGVFGPDDPGVSDLTAGVQTLFETGMFPLPTSGGSTYIDVRDLARGIVAALVPGKGPRRFMAGGAFVDWATWVGYLAEHSGRTFRTPTMPSPLLKGIGRVCDAAAAFGVDPPITYENAFHMTEAVPTDDADFLALPGVTYRPVEETTIDYLRWLVMAGHIDAERMPALASE